MFRVAPQSSGSVEAGRPWTQAIFDIFFYSLMLLRPSKILDCFVRRITANELHNMISIRHPFLIFVGFNFFRCLILIFFMLKFIVNGSTSFVYFSEELRIHFWHCCIHAFILWTYRKTDHFYFCDCRALGATCCPTEIHHDSKNGI